MVKGASGMSDGPASLMVVTAKLLREERSMIGLRQPMKSHPFPLAFPRNVFLEGAFVLHLGHVWANIFKHSYLLCLYNKP